MVEVVEDLSRASDDFPMERDCAGCGSKLRIDLSDLEYSKWKVGGYWFDDSAVVKGLYTFKCPACGMEANGNEVDESLVPVGTRQDLQAAYRARKAAGEPII